MKRIWKIAPLALAVGLLGGCTQAGWVRFAQAYSEAYQQGYRYPNPSQQQDNAAAQAIDNQTWQMQEQHDIDSLSQPQVPSVDTNFGGPASEASAASRPESCNPDLPQICN